VGSENAVTREASGADGASRGPIFVSGRQHSGNTVVAVLLGRLPGCLAQIDENAFFEHRRLVDNLQDAASRAERVFELLRLEHDGARAPVHEHLRRLARDRPRITALELYRDGMDFAAHFAGKRFWVQKATSYIFYGHEILSSMPDARMICLVRNPYDIVASRKRRNERRERIWSTMVSWNRGMTIVRSLEAQFPHRLRLVSYEDLTSRPEETVRSLVAWIGEPFDPACLDVPHVNRSETTYSLSGDGKGLNRTRVNYYVDNLSQAEIAGIDLLADRKLLDSFYPSLLHRSRRIGIVARMSGLGLVLGGPIRYGIDYASRLWRTPSLLMARTIRRLR